AGLRVVSWVSAVAMRLGEDSGARRGGKAQNSTRRLIALPSVAVLQAAQFGVQCRVGGEHTVGDLGDLLGVPPLPFQLRDFGLLVHGHLECEAPLRSETAQRQLTLRHVMNQLTRSAGSFHE